MAKRPEARDGFVDEANSFHSIKVSLQLLHCISQVRLFALPVSFESAVMVGGVTSW
jgi:hypothetical protein